MLTLLLTLLGAPAPCPGLPLAPQTTWTYRVNVAWAPPGSATIRRRVFTWTATVASYAARDSTAVAIVRGWPFELAWWDPDRAPGLSVLYCSAGRIYRLPSAADGAAPALADSLLGGLRRPTLDQLIFELPLRSGQLIGRGSTEREDTFYAWFTESAEAVPTRLRRLDAGAGDSLYQLAYRTMPDHQLVAFLPGLGVTRYVYGHHGTTAETDARLIEFRRGRPGE
jgi:hypothetical protein